MKRHKQRGMAALEMALALPLIAALMLLLVEGGNAIRVYSVLQEASREGARMVLMHGESSGVEQLVNTLTQDLPDTSLSTEVVTNTVANSVTVEVAYVYQSFLGANPALERFNDNEPFTFRASTTMPLP